MKLQFDKRPRPDLSKRIVHCFNWRQYSLLIIAIVLLVLSALASCGPSIEDLLAVDYTPLPGNDWNVSTPAEQGLGPMLVAELYYTMRLNWKPSTVCWLSRTAI